MNAMNSRILQLFFVMSLTGIALGQSTVDRTNSLGTLVVTDAETLNAAATTGGALNNGDTFTIKNGDVLGGGVFGLNGCSINIVSDSAGTVRTISSNGTRFFYSKEENEQPQTVTISLKDIAFVSGATGLGNGGGAIYVGDGDNLLILANNATFSNNSSNNTNNFGNGGAIVENNGKLTIQSADGATGTTSFFTNNTAVDNGGAIYATGTADVHNASFTTNQAGNSGGAIYSIGAITMSDSIFTGNAATVNGGGVYATASLTITGVNTFGSSDTPALGNSAVSGGAIASTSNISISGTNLFANNTATSTGGAIYTTGNITVSGNNTFSNNKASGDAGGAISVSSGDLTFNGADSVAVFSGNTQKNGVNNDIYVSGNAKSVTFTGNGTYTLNGGINSPNLNIENSANVSFENNAVNAFINVEISGQQTQASFGANTTTTSTGTVSVSNTAEGNVTFRGTQNFANLEITNGAAAFDSTSKNTAKQVTISGAASKVTFSGTKNDFDTLTFNNGATATFGAETVNTSDLVTVTGNTTQVTFQGTPDFTRMVVQNRGTAVLAIDTTNQIDALEVATGGTVEIQTTPAGSATITGDILVQSGGIVNVSDKDAKLIVTGDVSGAKNAHMNLAIYNTMEQANQWYYGVAGQTLQAASLSGEGGIVVNASGFKYHDETERYSLITITGAGNGYTLEEYEELITLPFAWFGELGAIIDVNGVEYSKEFNIFKIDGDKVPEPSTWALLILGAIGLAFYRRKASGVKA